MKWRLTLVLTGAVVLALLGPAVPAPAPAGTLRIGMESAPTTMDAALSTDLYSQQVYSHVLEGRRGACGPPWRSPGRRPPTAGSGRSSSGRM
jgi:hypothetical protein